MQVPKTARPLLPAKGMRVGIVTSRFNNDVTSALQQTAMQTLVENGVDQQAVAVFSVAGAVEIPHMLAVLARTKKYDCLVAIGCIIKGETPHFDYVCKTAQEGVLNVSLAYIIPIGFGVLTVFTTEQATDRYHVGGDAAYAALESALMARCV